MNDVGQLTRAAFRRTVRWFSLFMFLFAVAIFLPGGIGWTKGWVFLLVFLFLTVLSVPYLWRTNPEIFVARSEIHAGTKGWDKVILLFLIASFLAILSVAGLDSRFHWCSVPMWLIVLGYVLLSIGMVGSVWVQGVNKFAEPGVRIQTERGHSVVDTGPYAIVRHPFYVAAFFLYVGFPLALGSFWALIPAAIASLVLVVRTALEDRMLYAELEGYKEYAGRVQCRLMPGVW